nr:hypothetical protein [uncultured Sphingobacterium sp.]
MTNIVKGSTAGLILRACYFAIFLVVKWKNISKQDTLRKELYNKNNIVYPRKIYFNRNTIWTEGQKENRGADQNIKEYLVAILFLNSCFRSDSIITIRNT